MGTFLFIVFVLFCIVIACSDTPKYLVERSTTVRRVQGNRILTRERL